MKNTVSTPINLQEVCVRPLEGALEIQQARDFLDAHHYLKEVNTGGERFWYGVFDRCWQGLGVLVFCAASRRCLHWISKQPAHTTKPPPLQHASAIKSLRIRSEIT